jgi:hypothetical protein
MRRIIPLQDAAHQKHYEFLKLELQRIKDAELKSATAQNRHFGNLQQNRLRRNDKIAT